MLKKAKLVISFSVLLKLMVKNLTKKTDGPPKTHQISLSAARPVSWILHVLLFNVTDDLYIMDTIEMPD